MRESIAPCLACPRCRAPLSRDGLLRCTGPDCAFRDEGFARVGDTSVLVDFSTSILSRAALLDSSGASTLPRGSGRLRRFREWAEGRNERAAANCEAFLAAVAATGAGPKPRVLVIGGGGRGSGTRSLYESEDIRLVVTDVYAAKDVEFVADGHRLPFVDGSFAGVWIQAVLEHVTTPHEVVAEIERVLAPGGIVYAETPFMQPVHERAWDFTRFTRSGHRWLFRDFAEVRAGTIGGPAHSLLWAIRYLGRALFRSEKAGSLFVVLFFWVRFLDGFVDEGHRADAATGVFFLGRKTGVPIPASSLVAYYTGAGAPLA